MSVIFCDVYVERKRPSLSGRTDWVVRPRTCTLCGCVGRSLFLFCVSVCTTFVFCGSVLPVVPVSLYVYFILDTGMSRTNV